MNPKAIWAAGGAVVLTLAALSWPVSLSQPARPVLCKPGATLSFAYRGVPWWLTAQLAGQPIKVDQQWSSLHVALPADCPEGKHILEFEVGGLKTQKVAVEVQVDGTPPRLRVTQPAAGIAVAEERCQVLGHSEAGARVELLLGGLTVQGVVSKDGRFEFHPSLQPGWNELSLVATDAAGNQAEVKTRVFSDREVPRFSLERIEPDGSSSPLRGKDSPKDAFKVRVLAQDDSGIDFLRYKLDDAAWVRLPLEKKEDSWQAVFALRNLAEGTRRLKLEIRDRAGRLLEDESEFLVDSSEELGKKVLTLGARGEDVRQLQSRLVEAKVLDPSAVHGVFDGDTEKAVLAFQKVEGLPTTGRVARATLSALGPRILVNLARFELILDRPGLPPRRYPIACGSSDWPTPTGRFVIYEKVQDPSWIPPDSPWAKEAKTIPPGPDNPLGTRWIGLDWGNVGIHGTNADWSIGSASSHGCLRMYLADVEELYDLVKTDMPVTVFGGWEKDALVSRFWPGND